MNDIPMNIIIKVVSAKFFDMMLYILFHTCSDYYFYLCWTS